MHIEGVSLLKTMIFVGTNKSGSSREAIKAAERLGFFTVLFTNNEQQLLQREEYTDVHEMIFIDTNDLGKMKEEIRKLRGRGKDIKMIVSFVDANVYNASVLSDEFCRNVTTSAAIKSMENKGETRAILKNYPFTPKFVIIHANKPFSFKEGDYGLSFPLIVKSPHSTGSKDVLLAENNEQLKKHMKKLQNKDEVEIILEEFIAGEQYLVEVVVHKEKIFLVGLIKQEITKGKRFIITGYGVITDIPPTMKRELEALVKAIITKLKIKNGAMHLELRQTKKGWKLIEINPRISGGAMNHMLLAAFGYNIVEETMKLLLGETPSLEPKYKKHVFTQYRIVSEEGILEKVTGKTKAMKSQGVVDVYVKPKKGKRLIPPLSMGHRYAYVIATGESLEEARQLAKSAANKITFHLKKE